MALVLLALLHAAWFVLALVDHGRGRAFDLLDAYNLGAALGLVGFVVGWRYVLRQGRVGEARGRGVARALGLLDLVATAGLAILTLPLGS